MKEKGIISTNNYLQLQNVTMIAGSEVAEMWLKALETPAGRSLERAMDLIVTRSEVLNQNIANVNTPKYKRMDVDFSAVLAATINEKSLPMARTHSQHFAGSAAVGSAEPRVVIDSRTKERLDGNNVDVEFEMAQIAENAMHFQSLSLMWQNEMRKLKMAIEGRS
jgi:flagellar basal-body rod protein FlgB